MTPVTYIIAGPRGIGYHPSAINLATALGCTSMISEWDGASDLTPGVCAYISEHHIPPHDCCLVQVHDAADVRALANSIFMLALNPPHIDLAIERMRQGTTTERDAKQMTDHLETLRQRLENAYRQVERTERQLSVHG